MNQPVTPNRLGLCLSGGGFRASFFHIGTLARMAEHGMLKHVEVLSTVSGGSIVGAAYYLKLKKLLEEKTDADIEDQDYVNIVAELEQFFLTATQKNLRLRMFGDIKRNIRMSFRKYSRSDAMGEIYDSHIYSKLLNNSDKPINMDDLLIQPAGHTGKFHPLDEKTGNVKRIHKVPILMLNATSLNSGHNWVFTATKMGEVPPRSLFLGDLDKKDRYRRVRYDDIDTRTHRRSKHFLLGKAVAASAGVPGLFPPLSVSHHYKNRTVQLVDGGVYDNQGINGALDPESKCTDFVVSDACGQSEAIDNPATESVRVLGQASSILMGRVREEAVNCLLSNYDENHVAYFHLKRGILASDIQYNEQDNSSEPSRYTKDGIISSKQDFGVPQEMQDALSDMRTDLDSFSNPEARALEADAYLMCDKGLQKLPEYYRRAKKLDHPWTFKQYIPLLTSNDHQLLKHIKVGKEKFFKAYRLMWGAKFSKTMKLLGWSIPILICAAIYLVLAWLGISALWNNEEIMAYTLKDIIPWLLTAIGWFALFMVIEKYSHRLAYSLQSIRSFIRLPVFLVNHVAIPVLLYVPIKIYIHTINRCYVKVMGVLDKDEAVGHPGSGAVPTTGGT